MNYHIPASTFLTTYSAANEATFQQESDEPRVCLTMWLYEQSILPMDEFTVAYLKKKFRNAIKD